MNRSVASFHAHLVFCFRLIAASRFFRVNDSIERNRSLKEQSLVCLRALTAFVVPNTGATPETQRPLKISAHPGVLTIGLAHSINEAFGQLWMEV